MAKTIDDYLRELSSPKNIRFERLLVICRNIFGGSRDGKHNYIFSTPWADDPVINLQVDKGSSGKAKPYQVKQVIRALERMRG